MSDVLPSPTTALIVSDDVTAAALVATLVETFGYAVKFALSGEGGDASLRRARPRIYMIDCATTGLCSDDVIGRAIMRGVSVVLFGPPPVLSTMRDFGTRHDVEIVVMPPNSGPLEEILTRAARKSGAP
jgi:DNA-binding NtrC family response regulator